MYSFSWLHLPTFISQTTIVSEKKYCFTFFPYKSKRDQIWYCRKLGLGHPRVIIWTNQVVLEYQCCIQTFKLIDLLVPEKMIFWGFYHIWAWRPSWSCDLHRLIKLSFPYPIKAPHTIWLQSDKQFQRKRNLDLAMWNLTDLGPRSMNDIELWYSYKFMSSFS